MTEMNERLRALFAATELETDGRDYTLVRAPLTERQAVLNALTDIDDETPCALMIEPAEISVMVQTKQWARAHGLAIKGAKLERGWRLLTLRVVVSLDVPGYLAPLASLLSENEVSLYVVSAYSTDHLFIQQRHFETATHVLNEFLAECREGHSDI